MTKSRVNETFGTIYLMRGDMKDFIQNTRASYDAVTAEYAPKNPYRKTHLRISCREIGDGF